MSEADVVHIVSYDVSRGAERYARALVDTLNRHGPEKHALMTMFVGEEDTLDPDFSLNVPRGALRRLGLDPRVTTRMRRAVREIGPTAAIAHGGEPAKYCAFALGGLAPYAYLVIGSAHPKLGNPVRRILWKTYLNRAGAIVAVSDLLAAEVAAAQPSVASRIHVIPNGRDPEVFIPGTRRATKPRVLFIGHLDQQKRPLLFVEAMSALSRRGAAVAAAIVGEGPLSGEVEAKAAPLGIEMLGRRDDVPDLLSSADLLVATSRPPEGLPGVLIEAGLSGVATVTTDVPGARAIVEDGVTGLVVPVDEPGMLADAVESLVLDSGRRDSMGRAARERCLRLFTIEATVAKWLDVIQGLRE